MPNCTDTKFDFAYVGRRINQGNSSHGELSSDDGLLLLREVDEHLGLSRAAVDAISIGKTLPD
jgi:hypothetical protein